MRLVAVRDAQEVVQIFAFTRKAQADAFAAEMLMLGYGVAQSESIDTRRIEYGSREPVAVLDSSSRIKTNPPR